MDRHTLDRAQSRAWVEVDLDLLAANMRHIRSLIRPGSRVAAVVKADAYGHGARHIAPVLLQHGADRLAVACLDEAIELRQAGIQAPILILGPTPAACSEAVVAYDLTPTVFCAQSAQALSDQAVKQNKRLSVHVKIDTGMSRIGLMPQAETVAVLTGMQALPGLHLAGLFTHFPAADQVDERETRAAFDRFMRFSQQLAQQGLSIPIQHVCNSAATLRFPHMHLDLVRPGLILYGMLPANHLDPGHKLKPVMTVKTRVVRNQLIPAGSQVGYGNSCRLTTDRQVATLSIGYADGYLRRLAGRASVLIRGKRAPLLGSICMDLCMVDVTEAGGAAIQPGEDVILFGDQAQTLPVADLARWSASIHYEMTCLVGRRLPKLYMRAGRPVCVRQDVGRSDSCSKT